MPAGGSELREQNKTIIVDKNTLKQELKALVIEECDKDITPDAIADDAVLIGENSPLELDSLDALQVSLAIKHKYGTRIEGGKETRAALTSINTLADYIIAN